tara:strand:+ start:887 stop:1570 length:684 start_codon:yes stop_codon:yes gene_type:complete
MENSSDYNDPWTERKHPSAGSGAAGHLRDSLRKTKSLFADFIPYISVHKAYQSGINSGEGKDGSIVFETTRVLFNEIQEPSSETYQLLKTFKPTLDGRDSHLTFFGENPKIYSFSGSLFHLQIPGTEATAAASGNTPDTVSDGNWYDSFRYSYNNLLRGSKCAEKGFQVRVSFDYRWAQGYLLNFSANFSASSPGVIPFSFNMFVSDSGLYHQESEVTAAGIIAKIK